METAKANPKIIDVRDATEAAVECCRKLNPRASDISLEEIELSEDEKFWFITLEFYEDNPILPTDAPSIFGKKRKLKIFKVDANTGRVISMKIRSIE